MFVPPPPPSAQDLAVQAQELLADRCFACHGPDESARQAGLRLDDREALLAAGLLTPGDPTTSELVARILDADDPMPPVDSKLELSEAERQTLVDWVAEGAAWPTHWAWTAPLPPQLSSLPPWADPWSRDSLDRVVAAELAARGVEPGEEADRAAWLRRASVVLTGIPPSPEELAQFEASADPRAFEHEVERLLSSPRYGEHLASTWLDAARYADTYGYQNDVDRTVWPWRDWVIEAFQSDLPFDAFLTQQLAGDLLEGASAETRLATAFNRLHRQTNEGGSVEEEFRVEYVADRVNTFSTAVLGLTLDCARCHDHKYDPFTQREYYGLAGFFDNIDESGLYSHFSSAVPTPTVDLPNDSQARAREELAARLSRAEQGALTTPFDEAAFTEWTSAFRGTAEPRSELPGLAGLYLLDEGKATSLANGAPEGKNGNLKGGNLWVEGRRGSGIQLTGDDPAEFLGVGVYRRWDPFTLGLWVQPTEHHDRAVLLHRSRAWHDSGSRGYQVLLEEGRPSFSLIHFWPGNAVRIRALEPLRVSAWTHLAVSHDGSGRAAGLKLFVDGQEVPVEVVRDRLTRTIKGSGEGLLTIGQRFRDNGFRGGLVDELVVVDRAVAPWEVRHLAGLEPEPPTLEELREVFLARGGGGLRQRALKELHAARQASCELQDQILEVMAMEDMGGDRPTHLLNRGVYDQRGEVVETHTPALFPAIETDGAPTRLDLARWLTRPDHPLTSRVAVNRWWQLVFGEGIVATQENFGVQGARPWSQALLDHLALEYQREGWSTRRLLSRLVLSSTFRLAEPPLPGIDPRRRLTAESLRDHALHASGLLVERVGGPSVKPYQPAGLWQEKSGRVYDQGRGEALYRRSIYTFWKRTSPPPTMMIFDAAKRDVCVVRRRETTTPMQALALWNDPQYAEAARVLAASLLTEQATDLERLERLFLTCASRLPTVEEIAASMDLLADLRLEYETDAAAAEELLSVGEAPAAVGLDPAHHAAWSLLVNTVFSHHASVSLR